ncbi:L-arabinose transport system permease protein AraQ [Bifidobacterium longum subsp. infantis]|uniref:L-arabinose transport system permease protein AraQ n=2 Tax=Bifidobacterium longum TaxID=216816 RepID=A0A564RWS8_BIFLI|nr:carbohydrate ABC transporter permease [Bifidobacterium longum]VUW82012.1 L-arabinose transport system permease protein AraQ [Bifidobacterium longum subsp. infantis]VUX31690.1 L-arabinose transport system permease protein AraQ [Bifidobacterium longum subsp. infantis]
MKTSPMNRRRKIFRPSRSIMLAITVVLSLVFMLPAVWMFFGSFRPANQILSSLNPLSWNSLFPSEYSMNNYITLLFERGFARNLLNSAIVCIGSVALGLVLSLMAAYALAVLKFPGRNLLFAIVIVGFMVPFEAVAIPLSSLFTDWGLANTFLGLILPGIGNGLAIFNLRQFFLGIPVSYREAAKIDGASEIRILFQIYAPISVPALINTGLLIFLAQWSSYLWPLLMVNTSDMQVAAVSLASTFGERGVDYGQNFAGALMLALVPAILMLVFQRYFAAGSSSSGEK